MGKFFDIEGFLQRLEEVRRASGLSKGEFGKKIGVQNVFARYGVSKPGQKDRKIQSPSVETVLTIAIEFDVDVNWLLTGQVLATNTQTASVGSGDTRLPWLYELEPRLAALDETSQLAIQGALEGMLGPLESKRLNETLTKPPPRKAAAGPARARRR